VLDRLSPVRAHEWPPATGDGPDHFADAGQLGWRLRRVRSCGNNPSQTEAFLIHEELHSLGLGENPPSPKEITARVLALCHP